MRNCLSPARPYITMVQQTINEMRSQKQRAAVNYKIGKRNRVSWQGIWQVIVTVDVDLMTIQFCRVVVAQPQENSLWLSCRHHPSRLPVLLEWRHSFQNFTLHKLRQTTMPINRIKFSEWKTENSDINNYKCNVQ